MSEYEGKRRYRVNMLTPTKTWSADSAMDALRDRLVRPWRTPVEAAPEDQDPAPPWVVAVVSAVLPRIHPADGHVAFAAIEWCAAGDAPQRAEVVCNLARLWPGPEFAAALTMFLTDATACGAGRARGAKPRHYVPIHVARTWEEHDHKTRGRVVDAAPPALASRQCT